MSQIVVPRVFIPETVIVDALRTYLNALDIGGIFTRVTVNVTNDHPFAQLTNGMINHGGRVNTAGLFPALIVTTQEDAGNPDLPLGLAVESSVIALDSTAGLADSYTVTDKTLTDVEAAITAQGGLLRGRHYQFRRRDTMGIEIWAENVLMKNELYDFCKLFVLSLMEQKSMKPYEDFALALFPQSVQGERSNNYNFDFGLALAGAHIRFELSYLNELLLFDTEIEDTLIDGFIAQNSVYAREEATEGIIMLGGSL